VQRSGIDLFFPRFILLVGNWHVYTLTGSVCPPVAGMKPAYLNFVLQLSQLVCNHTPMCERTESVLLGDPQVEKCVCKTPLLTLFRPELA